MVQVIATPTQFAALDSQPFAITSGAPFQLTFNANLPPSSSSSGYFLLAFTDSLGNITAIPAPSVGAVDAESLAFAPGKMALGTATTDSAGNYQLSLTSLGASSNILEGTYAGDAQHWPAYAGNPSGCTDGSGNLLTTDQRGRPRPDQASSVYDIGAVERQK